MYTLINGSQKNHRSNSQYFLEYICRYLKDYKLCNLKEDSMESILANIESSDTIILAFPLYVDSPNSLTLSLLDYIYDNDIVVDGKKIYTVINCGFREGEHNLTALNIIKNWCQKTKTIYSGSILIGAGEIVGKKHYRFISHRALRKLKQFSISISSNIPSSDQVTTMDLLNNKVYCLLANKSWNKRGKKNNLSRQDIGRL